MRLAVALLALLAPLAAEESRGDSSAEGMVLIPAGEFQMGRAELTEDDAKGMRPLILRDDRPYHAVELDAYWMDAKEVTHAEYAAFVEASGRMPPRHWVDGEMPSMRSSQPIYNVDWHDARAYCEWAGKRLPTEAEWERAGRGGLEGKDYPWGDEGPTPETARYNTPLGPGPVGDFEPNGLGLYDMAGGVSEWCLDWFDRTYYERSPAKNPRGPEEGMYRIIRGGAWSDAPKRLKVYFRNWVRPDQKSANIGFRCVKTAAEDAE